MKKLKTGLTIVALALVPMHVLAEERLVLGEVSPENREYVKDCTYPDTPSELYFYTDSLHEDSFMFSISNELIPSDETNSVVTVHRGVEPSLEGQIIDRSIKNYGINVEANMLLCNHGILTTLLKGDLVISGENEKYTFEKSFSLEEISKIEGVNVELYIKQSIYSKNLESEQFLGLQIGIIIKNLPMEFISKSNDKILDDEMQVHLKLNLL